MLGLSGRTTAIAATVGVAAGAGVAYGANKLTGEDGAAALVAIGYASGAATSGVFSRLLAPPADAVDDAAKGARLLSKFAGGHAIYAGGAVIGAAAVLAAALYAGRE